MQNAYILVHRDTARNIRRCVYLAVTIFTALCILMAYAIVMAYPMYKAVVENGERALAGYARSQAIERGIIGKINSP